MIVPRHFDVIIAGAGPAGCACAFSLAGLGLKIAVIDKSIFPRDKICGDALSADVINQLNRMSPALLTSFDGFEHKMPSNGVRFVAPNYKQLDIDFKNPAYTGAAGFVARRVDFVIFFFNQISSMDGVSVFQDQDIKNITYSNDSVCVETAKERFSADMAVGADGANSAVARLLTDNKFERKHFCAGLRQYYENVTGFHEGNHIELHFYKELLPGYFWIFPLTQNRANVGLGILSEEVAKKKMNLKDKLRDIINNHPNVSRRFKDARPLDQISGFGLPIGSKKRVLSGNRFVLAGDAAGLIDPFTGEGIGNAIRSGRIAAEHIKKSFGSHRFDAEQNRQYDKAIYESMWKELKISRSMQNMLKYPGIFNFVVNRASDNESVKLLLTSMLDNIDIKKELIKPSFYMKLLFN